jgi:hypothetical protein
VKKIFRIPSISGINRRRYIKNMILKLKNSNITNILDIGSGIKNWSYLFSNKTHYDTVDLRDNVNATYVGDFFNISFLTKYDFIIATELIEHLPNTKYFFERVNYLLEDDGLLLISFPFFFKIHADPNDYYRFTLQGIEELAKEHFEVIDSYHHGNKVQIIWETFVDGKYLYPLKLLNYIIAKIDFRDKYFPLGYVVVLRKK